MLENHLLKKGDDGEVVEMELDLDKTAEETEGYSGSDIKLLCKECAMRPVRRLLRKLEEMETESESGVVEEAAVNELVESNPITQDDLDESKKCTNKSAGEKLHQKYTAWTKEFGSS